MLDPKPDYVVASGSLPPGVSKDFYALLAQRVKMLKSRLMVDTSGEELRLAVEEGVYLLKLNMHELGELAGREVKNESELEAIAMKIIETRQSEVVVVSLGAAGAFVVSKHGDVRLRAPAVPIKSKIGAGDSMVGGIVLSLAQGRSLREAVLFGIAAGAAAVMTPGTELCRREDTERLYRQMISDRNSSKET